MPRDRAQVRVFLSTSMASKKHARLRKRLCRVLKRDPLLEVFAIETRASADSATEIMLRRIELWADVVLVVLERDLRPGVDRELNLAMRLGKRVLILTHDGRRTPELSALIEDLRRDGRPFQRDYSTLRQLTRLAKDSLRHDIVDAYRNSQRELFLLRKHVGGLIPETTKACHSYLTHHFIGAEDDQEIAPQPEGTATLRLMQAIIDGSAPLPDEDLLQVIRLLPGQYRETVELRWLAIGAALIGDYRGAFRHLRAAQAEAERERLPLWVMRDIVLDLQYMEIHRYNQGEAIDTSRVGSFQQELRSLSGWEYRSPVYYDLYALGHRFLSETVKSRLTGERTMVFGSNLPLHLDELSEALVSGIWLGSYNVLRVVRDVLSEVLLHYGFEHRDGRLLCEGLRLLAIEGEHRRLEDFLKLHTQLVADRSRNCLLPPGGFPALGRDLPHIWIARSLLYQYLGDYVPDEELGEVRKFFQMCYEFDVNRGFHGNVMRHAVRALPRFAARFDANWVTQIADPLLPGHPMVAGEATAALCSARLADVDDHVLMRITDQLLARVDHSVPPRTLNLLLNVSEVSEKCAAKITGALIEMWHKKRSVLPVQFFAATDLHPGEELLADMTSEIVSSIDRTDSELTKASPMKFAGVSRWQLLAALIDRDSGQVNIDIMAVAERVLANPNRTGAEKRDCLESLLWLETNGKLSCHVLVEPGNGLLTSREPEVLTAKGPESVFSASREELGLYAAALTAVASSCGFDALLNRVSGAVSHERLDTRLAAVAASRYSLARMDEQSLDCLILLLRAFIRDEHFEVRHFASHAVSEALHQKGEADSSMEEIAGTLFRDPHPLVRAGVLHAAASWGKAPWVTGLLVTGSEDASYQVRSTAVTQLAELGSRE